MNWGRTRLSRLPLRVRLVAGFSAAMFVVLLGAGTFVYWRVQYALDRGLNAELTQAMHSLDPLVRANGTVTSRVAADATGVAWQVLDANGHVLDHGGPASATAMVSADQLADGGDQTHTIDLGGLLPASAHPFRLRVTPASASRRLYLLVGVRRDHRDEALRELLAQLAVAGFVALVITAFVGDRLARAALRPVERYRRRAAEIADGAVDLRLDVPRDRDDEVTRLGHTFNDMLTGLERALDRERQFVHEASHELRTPITLLSGRIQLARRRKRTVAQHEQVLAELQTDLDRLASMAEQLLELGAARSAVSHGSADLNQVVTRVVAQRRGVTKSGLSVELSRETTPVAMAETPAERVVANLFDNARVHGAAPYRVVVDQPEPAWVRLQITDAGTGMSGALLAGATQRFTRADDARARPGAGLGLALVEVLVRDAGGELRLCFDGNHVSHGRPAEIDCAHGPEMTVTVLLPAAFIEP
jgi:signal transduction histidine kinase